MNISLLATSTDIVDFAQRRDAESWLPKIARRLILGSTPSVTAIDFRAEEGIQLAGFDGAVTCGSGNPWVPAGNSVWELSRRKDPKGKAEEDYVKRTADDSLGINKSSTTYVALTVQRWNNKAKWEAEKKTQGVWADVRAFDADDIATWLEQAPAVHIWISRILGTYPVDVVDLETKSLEWVTATSPELPLAALRGGRAEQDKRVREWLAGDASLLSCKAETEDEAVSYLAASCELLPDIERERTYSRTIVVESLDAWRLLVAAEKSLLLIPTFSDRAGAPLAVTKGNHVFVPHDATGSSRVHMDLPPPSRESLLETLREQGLDDTRSRELAGIGGQSLLAMRRQLAVDQLLMQPAWASPDRASLLVPALLIGRWQTSNSSDRDIVNAIAHRPYEEVESMLTALGKQADAPVKLVDGTWSFVSRQDAWVLLSPYFTETQLTDIRNATVSVLGEDDTTFDLEAGQRYMAGAIGKGTLHSSDIRRGLSELLVYFAVEAASPMANRQTGQQLADGVIFNLLQLNADARRWQSTSTLLPTLAEAAPAHFLDAVEHVLDQPSNPLAALFADDRNQMFSGNSQHTSLLWALEKLAWSGEYLTRVVIILSRLHKLDPGGTLSNRPAASLGDIFRLTHPGTNASPDQRLRAIDQIRKRDHDLGWDVMISSLPEDGGFMVPRSHALLRAELSLSRRVTWGEVWSLTEEILTRLLADIDAVRLPDADRLKSILMQLYRVRDDAVAKIEAKFLGFDVGAWDPSVRSDVWIFTKDLISHNQRRTSEFPALSDSVTNAFESIASKLEPTELKDNALWLFADNALVNFPADGESYAAHEESIRQQRIDLVSGLIEENGPNCILGLAGSVSNPFLLGLAAASVITSPADVKDFLAGCLGSEARSLWALGRGFIEGKRTVVGPEWTEQALDKPLLPDMTNRQIAELCITLGLTESTMSRVIGYGDSVGVMFWEGIRGFFPLGLPAEAQEVAIRELLRLGLVRKAVDMAGSSVASHGTKLNTDLITELLSKFLEIDFGNSHVDQMETYYIEGLFDALANRDDVDFGSLARLEWSYMPLLTRRGRPLRALYGELASKPEFFYEILSWVYKRSDQEEAEIPEGEEEIVRRRVMAGWELLEHWNQPPGLQPDGTVDESQVQAWVKKVRELARGEMRLVVADIRIGKILDLLPIGKDGIWPNESVRTVLEEETSQEIEHGLEESLQNRRGVTSRHPHEGGTQERVLSAMYSEWSTTLRDSYPRTSRMLARIAKAYEAEAQRHDQDAARSVESAWDDR